MYCESKISHIDYGDVEHIKPKSKFLEEKYNWENLGYSCPACNREYKNENYDPNLINPYDTDPRNYLYFIGGIIRSKGGNIKGQITIEIIQLI
jgi:5-methylcytosine-specific restriction endonuclease McrA